MTVLARSGFRSVLLKNATALLSFNHHQFIKVQRIFLINFLASMQHSASEIGKSKHLSRAERH